MKEFTGIFFNSGSSQKNEATLKLSVDSFSITLPNKEIEIPYTDIKVAAPFEGCPLVLELSTGERFETTRRDISSLEIKELLGSRSQVLYWLENNHKAILGSFLALVLSLFIIIKYVVPIASNKVAAYVPQSWKVALDKSIMERLEGEYISPSEVPIERQKELKSYFKKHYNAKVKIHFRKSKAFGANAFALAGETVIFTDDLLNTLKNDKFLLGIYLHEVGHIKNNHLVSQMIAAASLSIFSSLIIGDLAGMTESLASIGYSLISLSYSRTYELDADNFAGKILTKNKISALCLSEGLGTLTKSILKEKGIEDTDATVFSKYLSTHPVSEEREMALKKSFPENSFKCEKATQPLK